ncbi:MAG: helix-turn-helix domain-containing protein [Actinomycetota bacterium]
MPDLTDRWGLYIRALRESRGWTVAELAELAGVHRDTIYELESNPHPNPRLDTLLQIARAFTAEV